MDLDLRPLQSILSHTYTCTRYFSDTSPPRRRSHLSAQLLIYLRALIRYSKIMRLLVNLRETRTLLDHLKGYETSVGPPKEDKGVQFRDD